MSAPLVMAAVDTHVTTPLAPTTAPVILGTDWVTTGTDVTVSECMHMSVQEALCCVLYQWVY